MQYKALLLCCFAITTTIAQQQNKPVHQIKKPITIAVAAKTVAGAVSAKKAPLPNIELLKKEARKKLQQLGIKEFDIEKILRWYYAGKTKQDLKQSQAARQKIESDRQEMLVELEGRFTQSVWKKILQALEHDNISLAQHVSHLSISEVQQQDQFEQERKYNIAIEQAKDDSLPVYKPRSLDEIEIELLSMAAPIHIPLLVRLTALRKKQEVASLSQPETLYKNFMESYIVTSIQGKYPNDTWNQIVFLLQTFDMSQETAKNLNTRPQQESPQSSQRSDIPSPASPTVTKPEISEQKSDSPVSGSPKPGKRLPVHHSSKASRVLVLPPDIAGNSARTPRSQVGQAATPCTTPQQRNSNSSNGCSC